MQLFGLPLIGFGQLSIDLLVIAFGGDGGSSTVSDVVVVSSAIDGWTKNGNSDTAADVVNTMNDLRLIPSLFIPASLLYAFWNHFHWEKKKEMINNDDEVNNNMRDDFLHCYYIKKQIMNHACLIISDHVQYQNLPMIQLGD